MLIKQNCAVFIAESIPKSPSATVIKSVCWLQAATVRSVYSSHPATSLYTVNVPRVIITVTCAIIRDGADRSSSKPFRIVKHTVVPYIIHNTRTFQYFSAVDPACWADRLPKFENSKMAWNYSELIRPTRMYRIDVWASHYKINPPLLTTVSGYKY